MLMFLFVSTNIICIKRNHYKYFSYAFTFLQSKCDIIHIVDNNDLLKYSECLLILFAFYYGNKLDRLIMAATCSTILSCELSMDIYGKTPS